MLILPLLLAASDALRLEDYEVYFPHVLRRELLPRGGRSYTPHPIPPPRGGRGHHPSHRPLGKPLPERRGLNPPGHFPM